MYGEGAMSLFSKGERHSLTKIIRRFRWRCKTVFEQLIKRQPCTNLQMTKRLKLLRSCSLAKQMFGSQHRRIWRAKPVINYVKHCG